MVLSPRVRDWLSTFLVVLTVGALVAFAFLFEDQRDMITGALIAMATSIKIAFFTGDDRPPE